MNRSLGGRQAFCEGRTGYFVRQSVDCGTQNGGTTMNNLEISDFSTPDDIRRPDPTVAIEVVKMAGREIGRYPFQPGWRWSEHVKPVVGGDACMTDHIGYVVSGRMGIQTDDGALRLSPDRRDKFIETSPQINWERGD